ncbi:MAG: hypothetical protein ACI379_03300 [Nocardioides sp.]|uniref:hypothetical protein n=1 Tax=Nocardioides sp. TaxID=35761 RepID=UPI003F08A4EF
MLVERVVHDPVGGSEDELVAGLERLRLPGRSGGDDLVLDRPVVLDRLVEVDGVPVVGRDELARFLRGRLALLPRPHRGVLGVELHRVVGGGDVVLLTAGAAGGGLHLPPRVGDQAGGGGGGPADQGGDDRADDERGPATGTAGPGQ